MDWSKIDGGRNPHGINRWKPLGPIYYECSAWIFVKNDKVYALLCPRWHMLSFCMLVFGLRFVIVYCGFDTNIYICLLLGIFDNWITEAWSSVRNACQKAPYWLSSCMIVNLGPVNMHFWPKFKVRWQVNIAYQLWLLGCLAYLMCVYSSI